MESFGTFFDEEWESLSRLFSGDQDSDQLSGDGIFSNEVQDYGLNFEITPSIVSSIMIDEDNNANPSSIIDHGFCYGYENINPNFYHHFSQETSASSLPYLSSNITPLPINGVCDHEPVDLYEEINKNSSLTAQVLSNNSMENFLCLRQNVNTENENPVADQLKNMPTKRKIEDAVEEKVNEEKQDEKPKKKTRVTKDNKNKKKVQPKKKQKVMDATINGVGIDGSEDVNTNKGVNAPIASSSSCSSEDDLNGGGVNSNWKTRAGRGAATDPQSLYARKRRERINERLKVLQNLVPNGTKVDISTMLEEAVQYVKFLQLQIKLLSSDEMWMYAPIAYNGMDMGLYQKISQS